VWVGLSKETAHQLGTPISSLMAWKEMLKIKSTDVQLVSELEKDVNRLEKITERFSKIGSKPKLKAEDINPVIENAIDYLKTRSSKNIQFKVNTADSPVIIPLNIPLFEWVLENVCKNAMDAIDGNGLIQVSVIDNQKYIFVDITDNGKGIPRNRHKTVFKPGYTTKERGWGLGLSLTKRIVEEYHGGKIFVASSEPGKGTTMRVILNRTV
jgi:signal transduction histidine kinase